MKSFAGGVVVGILLCLGVQWLIDQQNRQQSQEATTVPEAGEPAGPVLDFYTRLREVEVLIPGDTPELKTPDTSYVLQAGSFRQAREAEQVRAELILLNLDANIHKFNHNGEIWHRVLVGPFDNRSSTTDTRSLLLEHGVESLLMTQEIATP